MSNEVQYPSNAAAMREALTMLRKKITDWYMNDWIPYNQYDECEDISKAALAAPPRNCDRFKTKEEAAIAFAKEKNQWIPQQVLWELAPWLDWLLAPSTEQKGENNGSK